MEPIPETVDAVRSLGPSADGGALLTDLTRLAGLAKKIVPDLLGVSIARLDEGITFTLVATAKDVAVLDAVQYIAGGPCVDAAHTVRVREFDHGAVDEERWQLFAEATAARAVRSTLTLPVQREEQVVGTVNMYAASRRAFVGHHAQLAELFGAWASGAVSNADLSFRTRAEAEAAPRRLREQRVIDLATGILAAALGLEVEAAKIRLRDAAVRAGVTPLQLASEIVRARGVEADAED
jgi:GAF domain-containing protein